MAETGKPEYSKVEGGWRDFIPEFLTELGRVDSFPYEQRTTVQRRSERIKSFVDDEEPWSMDSFLEILEDSDARYGYRSSPARSIDLITKGSPTEFERLQIEWRRLYRDAGSDDSYLTPQGFTRILGAFRNFGLAYHSELLSNLYPRRFWQLNGQVDRFFRLINPDVPPGFSKAELRYFMVRPLIDSVLEVLGKVLEDADYRVADHFIYWLMNEKLPKQSEPGIAYWKVSPGDNAWHWDECRTGGFIAIGWDALGDLSGISREDFHARWKAARVDSARSGWSDATEEQLWKFVKSVKPGDRIVANRGTTEVLGIGTVTGPYEFVPGVRHGHRWSVRWDDTSLRTVDEPGWRRTFVSITEKKFSDILSIKPKETLETAEPSSDLINLGNARCGLGRIPDSSHL